MSTKNTKPDFPFMVFSEAFDLPDGRNACGVLNDPNTPQEERDALRRGFNDDEEIAFATARRDTQEARHAENHRERDMIMADLRRDADGKPVRHEPKRLAGKYNVAEKKIRKWIEQLAGKTSFEPPAFGSDWRIVYHGQALRAWYRDNGKRKRKGASVCWRYGAMRYAR